MSLAYYGLSFNPFDKQMVQEKDRFLSRDMTEMTQRLDYLKDARGDRGLYRPFRHGEILLPALFREEPEPQPVPHGIHLPLHRQCHGILPPVLRCVGRQ